MGAERLLATGDERLGEDLDEADEVRRLRHEVRLALERDDGPDPLVPVDDDGDGALGARSRPARLADPARPCSRSQRLAFSKSPSVSTSARRASRIPAPVAWRSAFTS